MRSRRTRALAAAIALALVALLGVHRPLTALLAPAIATVLVLVQPRMQPLLVEPRGDRLVTELAVARPIALPPATVIAPSADARIAAHVATANLLQLPLVVLAVALLAPARTTRELFAIVALAAGSAIALFIVDAAIALAGAAWSVLRAAHPQLPVSNAESIALFMTLGGRIALGIAWGVVCVRCGRWLEDGWPD